MDAALLFQHTHTPDSNRFERAVRDFPIDSHATDYLALARALPAGTDAVFVKTDHWRTDPAFVDRFEDRLGADAALATFERHLVFEVGGTRAAVVNGVEGSVRTDRYHVTLCGLPLADADEYRALSMAELATACDRAAWVAPAHVGLPGHRYPPGLLADVFGTVEAATARGALGYPTGYTRLCNRLARNAVPGRESVRSLADSLGVALVPELDLHATVPPRYGGCGVCPRAVVDDLVEGTLPVRALLGADLLAPDGRVPGLSLGTLLRTYDALLPGPRPDRDWDRRFRASIPDADAVDGLDPGTDVVSLP